ncbi:tyrosine-protein phosphatase [Lactiplantibacillus plantarum]|uniref:tyrosine-protein phosphatase n=1 Tax=Lactiplantibacillus plantarum TaxID=1590 RepID=UPI001BADA16A|nr:tyrosine-protein phosphatase [Lactiplantibacillus plantarum]MBS0937900.1 tyrosine-protein phosphatase [Lactiplantibacillus plantarum]MBS0945955.1 tyrosine-protein phosphatase [Lactiplantibacillus plantarum]
MEPIVNLRDLGGIRNQNRQLVKSGLVFRSGQLDELSTEQVQYLDEALKITRIVDMRSAAERKQFPDVIWSQAQYTVLDVLKNESKNGASLQSMITDSGNVQARMFSLYEQLALDTTARQCYHQFIKLLLVPNQPLIFHCFAGKDRTGVGASLFLKILAVSDEQIMIDYLKTNQMRVTANEKILEELADQITKEQKQAIEQALLVDADYLTHYFDTIQEHYGSFDSYLKIGLNLTNEDLKQLRKTYLVS